MISTTKGSSISGESPPPPPRACFGRSELIETIVRLAENLVPIALVGAGGIGKTSTVLTILHDKRIKQRFGDNRRFIRCDQFPASRTHLLRRLSEVIGAGIENPGDLTPLRPSLSSEEMLIVLDNAESILDLQGTSAQETYAAVEELSHFSNICLCITSRISIIPPDCTILNVPTLSMEAAHDTFSRIYTHGERSDPINKILEQLDFHPLSITLLATVAQHSGWDINRLAREWERQRTGMLRVQHSGSLAATIELSLASPMFQELGPDARALLGVIAFLPQGVDENNLDWLFPTIPDRTNIFDKFCILSLTYRSNGVIIMLAPLRDYFCPQDPMSSSLLHATKDSYFSRLSVDVHPGKPGYEEARWITSEDVNAEHLLNVFTSIDTGSGDIWDTCAHFMEHLYRHKARPVILGPKVEGLSDDHPSKPECMLQLSLLYNSVGNYLGYKELLVHILRLWRERGNDHRVGQALKYLCDANRQIGLYKEGIQQAQEGLGIYEQLGDAVGQAECLCILALSLLRDGQLDATEEAASRAINLLPEEGNQFLLCRCHRALGLVYCYFSDTETEKAVHHFEIALGIASSFGWHDQVFWIRFSLTELSLIRDKIDDAHIHVEQAKPFVVNSYQLAQGMKLQARVLREQLRLEESESEALRAADIFQKLGAAQDLKECNELLRDIREELGDLEDQVKWWAPGNTAISCAYLLASLRSWGRTTALVVASIFQTRSAGTSSLTHLP